MASEKSKLLNRIEGEDDGPTPGVVSRNLARLCIITAVLMFFFMIASVALAAVLAYTKIDDDDNHANNNLCLTADCIQVAARLSSYMDTSVQPCDDFYKFSCGGWEDNNVIPDGLGRWGTFEQLAQSNYQFLIKALSDTSNTSEPEAVKKAKQIFAACTNLDQINKDKAQALTHFLTLTGGWNKTNVTQNATWSINSSLVVEHYYGSSAFFGFDIEPDDLNSSKAVIEVTGN